MLRLVLRARGLHHRGAREVPARALEHVDERDRRRHAGVVVAVLRVRVRDVLLEDPAAEREARILGPLGVGRILEDGDRDRALVDGLAAREIAEAHEVGRRGDRVDDDELRLPAELRRLDARLHGELPEREDEVRVRLRRLDLRDLGGDARGGRVVADERDDLLLPSRRAPSSARRPCPCRTRRPGRGRRASAWGSSSRCSGRRPGPPARSSG